MKRAVFLVLAVILAVCVLCSCQNAEEDYADKKIRIQVTHISGFAVDAEYDVYLENVREGESFELPHGEANLSYMVTVTITDVKKDGITLSFSEPMDRIPAEDVKWELEMESFQLTEGETECFITPTDGGGDKFVFSLVPKDEIYDVCE